MSAAPTAPARAPAAPDDLGPALRLALMAIVLTNLAFVHATEDASLSWLAPMYLATLLSPWLARLSANTAYRWTWNLAVIGIFGLLVQHTTSAGPRYLLEDGLRLAALCQVHVLCTLGARQRPDLLFFNSFLVAVVTAFLTQDLLYSVVFLAYAPLLVIGLALYASRRSGSPAAAVRRGLALAGATLAVTGIVFFAAPRDFGRKGLVVESLTLGPGVQSLEVGFVDEVRIGRHGETGASDALVMRVRLRSGDVADVPHHWRGATQLHFDGTRWNSGLSTGLGDQRWRDAGARALAKSDARKGPLLEVELADPSGGRAFAPMEAARIDFQTVLDEPAAPQPDGTVRISARTAAGTLREVRYAVRLAGAPPRLGGATPAKPAPALEPALALDPCHRVPEAEKLAKSLRAALPKDAPQEAIVDRFRERLAARTDYLPPGAADGAADLDSFVAGRAGGHCEHFAGALALMLRHVGIPCRLVTGYASDDWDERSRTLTIRRRDAHAWVEVKDPRGGWYTVDPTPASARASRRPKSFSASIGAWLQRTWEKVTRFDDEARTAVWTWIAAAPRRLADTIAAHPAVAALAAALAAAWTLLRRVRRARLVDPEVRVYLACLRRLRVAPLPGETPRALLARAAHLGLPAQSLARLEAATLRHEEARYAPRRG